MDIGPLTDRPKATNWGPWQVGDRFHLPSSSWVGWDTGDWGDSRWQVAVSAGMHDWRGHLSFCTPKTLCVFSCLSVCLSVSIYIWWLYIMQKQRCCILSNIHVHLKICMFKWEFPLHGDTPKKAWFIKENPTINGWFFWATPIFLESHGADFLAPDQRLVVKICACEPRWGKEHRFGGTLGKKFWKSIWIIWI